MKIITQLTARQRRRLRHALECCIVEFSDPVVAREYKTYAHEYKTIGKKLGFKLAKNDKDYTFKT